MRVLSIAYDHLAYELLNAFSMKQTEIENLVQMAYRSDAHVLITGATGTGKSLLARRIHDNSVRKHKPFIAINLATLHEGTFESELFGHEKGAFTGADCKRQGRLELAQGGTVFLDEVGELSLKSQARLLEFLQSRTIVPIGGGRETKLNVRVIAATHRDLTLAVARGEFREDLFHRICVIPIRLQSLADRHEDFDSIVHECLADLCKSMSKSMENAVLKISEEVAVRLENYNWPGNFRELRNVLEFAICSCRGREIGIRDLPPWFSHPTWTTSTQVVVDRSMQGSVAVLGVAELPLTLDYQDSLSRFEQEYLKRALKRFRGRLNQTAQQIGMSKTTLIRRLRAYRIDPETLFYTENFKN